MGIATELPSDLGGPTPFKSEQAEYSGSDPLGQVCDYCGFVIDEYG